MLQKKAIREREVGNCRPHLYLKLFHFSVLGVRTSVGTSPPFLRARAFEPFAQPVRALNELLSLATYNKSLSIGQIQMVNSVEHTLMLVVVTYTSF